MSKQEMLNQVTSNLHAIGVPVQIGTTTDLMVKHEFVDAGWSTGVKKITYEALAFFDEQSCTVYMWERTLESGSGFSGGFEGGTSFQSGSTLFRKVKSIQYGPDGKAYEYSLDLGAIPKTVKGVARQYGWKFKTVLKKDKAMYPASYQQAVYQQPVYPQSVDPLSPSGIPQSLPEAGHMHHPEKPNRSIFNTLATIAYVFLALIIFGLFALMPVKTIGWLIALPVLVLSAVLQFGVVKKGCVTGFLIWFFTTFILLVVFLFTYIPT